jgi:hypothetical protein
MELAQQQGRAGRAAQEQEAETGVEQECVAGLA